MIDAIPWNAFNEFPWNASLVNKAPPCPQNVSKAKAGSAICSSFGGTSCHALVSIPEAPKGLSGLGKAKPKKVFLHQPL